MRRPRKEETQRRLKSKRKPASPAAPEPDHKWVRSDSPEYCLDVVPQGEPRVFVKKK